MSEADKVKAKETLKKDNYFLDKYKRSTLKGDKLKSVLRQSIKASSQYGSLTEEETEEAVERIYKKLLVVNKEYFKAYEWLVAFIFAIGGYYAPKLLLVFQKMMRKLEIESEVMQFQTIILMLMKIESVNVEMILFYLYKMLLFFVLMRHL